MKFLTTFLMFALILFSSFSAVNNVSQPKGNSPFKFCFVPDTAWPKHKNTHGLSLGVVTFGKEEVKGADVGIVCERPEITGAQVGIVTKSKDITGGNVGVYNQADNLKRGAQVGIVNKCKNSNGIQIGIVNYMDNGFAKVFPFFNFPASWDN